MKVVDAKIPFLTDLALLSDLTRCRILRLLEGGYLNIDARTLLSCLSLA